MKKPLFASVALVACALSLGACSSGGSDSESKTSAATTTAVPVKSSPDGGVEEMPKIKDPKGVFKATKVESCEVGPGGVKAMGTVTNEAKKAQDIVVAVRWVEPEGNAIIDRDIAVLRQVEPGKSANWSATGDVSTKDAAVCSFSVTAGSIS